jgi:hypothetical protein
MYILLHIYFTAINSALVVPLKNRHGIDMQQHTPVQAPLPLVSDDPDNVTPNLVNFDMFDTGTNNLAQSNNWRRRISTLSFINSQSPLYTGFIIRTNTNLHHLDRNNNVNMTSIIDIIVTYERAKNNIVSQGIGPDYIEGESKRLEEGDMFVIQSNRHCSPYTYIVVQVTGVYPTDNDNEDTYFFNIHRF